MKISALLSLALIAVGGCDSAAGGAHADAALQTVSVVAESATSMPFLLRRFQAATAGRPDRLARAAPTRDQLVERFVDALERSDTASLTSMRVSPAEFAHLFFPESMFMRPPYELDPSIVWLQIDAGSNKGLRRAVQRFAGSPFGYRGLVCQPPQVQGTMRLHGCDVRRVTIGGDTTQERLFGAILERDGEFKFLSLENKL